MVALLTANGDPWGCGGTLVASKYVISAAHCLPGGVGPSDIKVGQKTQNFFSKIKIKIILLFRSDLEIMTLPVQWREV